MDGLSHLAALRADPRVIAAYDPELPRIFPRIFQGDCLDTRFVRSNVYLGRLAGSRRKIR
jgi:hypothetical protein